MTTIAIYSMKGGVGKTTLAVNLAWAAATLSSRRTLLWDLDAQGAATFTLAGDRAGAVPARDLLEKETSPERLIVATGTPRLDLLPADASLRSLDALFASLDKKKRLRRIAAGLDRDYERVILDCPPGLGETATQVIRGAALIVLPLVPSALSIRAMEEVRGYLDRHHKGGPPVLPVFTMVDRRRAAHRAALAAQPDRPVIPMASAVEEMADRHAAIGAYAPRSPAATAMAALWTRIERQLADQGGK